MKAMQLTGIRQMEMREVAAPFISSDNDVLIKMSAVGVCGSDIHYYTSGRIGDQIVKYPFTVGHEGAGQVVEVGSEVSTVKPGDRVAIDPAMPCYKCDQCGEGRFHTCRNLKFLGCPGQVEGCLSEYIVMPESSCFKIGNISVDEAVISEPLAIGIYAVKISVPMPSAKVAILGAGPVGLSVMLAAKYNGAETIYVTDRIDRRLEYAVTAGAKAGFNIDKCDAVKEILKAEQEGLDVVFECCGKQESLDQAIEILKPGGKLMIVGIPDVDIVSFDISKLRRKEICIQNVRRQCECTEQTIELLNNGLIDVKFMATHSFSFDKTKEAFDLVAGYRNGVLKAVIEFSPSAKSG